MTDVPDEDRTIITAIPEAKNPITDFFSQRSGPLDNVMCPGISFEQFMTMIIIEGNKLGTSLSKRALDDPKTKLSFLIAASNAAVIGLLPGEVQGHCYLVPGQRYKGKPHEFTQISLWMGYKGLMELAFASDFLAQCDPELHLAGEEIKRWHDDRPRILHEIPMDRPLPDRKNIAGAYCTYVTKAGGYGHAYVSRAEIAKVDSGYNVWKSNYPAMCLKTPIRRCAMRWRLNQRMAMAIRLEEASERGEAQPSFVPGIEQSEVPTVTLAQFKPTEEK